MKHRTAISEISGMCSMNNVALLQARRGCSERVEKYPFRHGGWAGSGVEPGLRVDLFWKAINLFEISAPFSTRNIKVHALTDSIVSYRKNDSAYFRSQHSARLPDSPFSYHFCPWRRCRTMSNSRSSSMGYIILSMVQS